MDYPDILANELAKFKNSKTKLPTGLSDHQAHSLLAFVLSAMKTRPAYKGNRVVGTQGSFATTFRAGNTDDELFRFIDRFYGSGFGRKFLHTSRTPQQALNKLKELTGAVPTE